MNRYTFSLLDAFGQEIWAVTMQEAIIGYDDNVTDGFVDMWTAVTKNAKVTTFPIPSWDERAPYSFRIERH